MTITIQDFYEKQLSSLSYAVNEDDLISFVDPGGTEVPATVDQRRLAMPTKALLRSGFDADVQPFHPLSENIARRSVSPVVQGMQRTARAVLAHYFTEIASYLLAVAADTSLHKDLPPACSEYLKKVPEADAKMLKVFEQLVGKAVKQNQLITLYLRNGGTYEGKKVNRLCVIRFPFMEELTSETPYGMKIRKKDRETLIALTHHIMPFGDSPEEYSAGSNSRVAPFYDAFMHAYAKAATRLNLMVRKYAKAMEIPLEEINMEYTDHMDDLGQFYDKIPSLRGNDGGTEDTPEPEAKPAPVKLADRTVTNTPPWEELPAEPSKTPPAKPAGTGMSISDFLTTLNPQRPPQPAYAQQQQQQPYAQPQPAYAQPYQQPYAQPQQPGYNAQPGPVAPYGGYSAQPPQYGNPYTQPQQPMQQPNQNWGNQYYNQAPQDPRNPTWLGGGGGQQPPQPPQNPFASAMRMGNAPPPNPYGNPGNPGTPHNSIL